MRERLAIGVQTRNAVSDEDPSAGFEVIREAGFTCADFSLNDYLMNSDLCAGQTNTFFDQSEADWQAFFMPHREAAARAGVRIHQMHMPYPVFVPLGMEELNTYLREVMAPKSLQICAFFGCRYIVIHGLKLRRELGSEEAEWQATERFLDHLAPLARELGITMCIENLYDSLGGHIVEGPCCDARKAADRIDAMNERYGAEVLGFCFDTGHANLVGLDFFDFLSTLGHRLKVLHIHDNDGIMDLHQIPFTFTRTRENHAITDWDGFLAGLSTIDFDGVLNFETGPVLTAFPRALRPQALGMIASIGGYFADTLAEKQAEKQDF